jgi:predicted dehydrogenase
MTELRIGVAGVGQRAGVATLANQRGKAPVVSCGDPDPRGRADARNRCGADVAIHDR